MLNSAGVVGGLPRLLRRRWLRYALGAVAALFLLAIAVLFGLPRLINIPAVSSHLEEQASKLVQGRVKWDTLQVRFLPSHARFCAASASTFPAPSAAEPRASKLICDSCRCS